MRSGQDHPLTSRYRWYICALLFFATVIAYIDRGVLAYLKDTLQHIIGWDEIQYGHIVASFKVAYGIGLVGAGWFTDRLGTRRSLAIAIALWSVAAMCPGAAASVLTFGLAMFLLGLGEATVFPACNKTVAEWFPKSERALAFGIFNSGANVGNMVVPFVVPLLVALVGWRGSFVATGASGFILLTVWLSMYRKPENHPRVSASELAHIQADPAEAVTRVPWLRLFPCKETWAFAFGKFLSDPIWWFYTFWLPGYLQKTFHMKNLSDNTWPVAVAFGLATLGSVGGGSLSSALLKAGWSLNRARKSAMLLCAIAVLPVLYAPFAKNVWVVVGLTGLAMAAHQGFSANLFTMASDLFPKAAVASVTGIGGMFGAGASALFDILTGHVVQWSGYVPIFIICGVSYFAALIAIHVMTPRYTPARLA